MSAPVSEEGSEEKRPESGGDDSSVAVVETAECPNCGCTFVGDYCPDCGQEADPPVSITGVIGRFFRELVDVENGFWATFVGLTFRPRQTLRAYLRGVRAGLASPGRYLLASVLFTVGVFQLTVWLRIETKTVVEPYMASGLGREAMEASSEQIEAFLGIYTNLVFYLLLAGVLALILRRLFSGQISRVAEGLGIGCFLVGHMLLLNDSVQLVGDLAEHFAFNHIFIEVLYWLQLLIPLVYLGVATYQTFDTGWESALKAVLGLLGALVEVISIFTIGTMGYAVWLVKAHPESYYLDFNPPLSLGVLSAPLLLHAGIEVYYRVT